MEIVQPFSLYYITTMAISLLATRRASGFVSWELLWKSWIHDKGVASRQNLNDIQILKLGNPESQETFALRHSSKLLNSTSAVNIYLMQTSFCWSVNFNSMFLWQAVLGCLAWNPASTGTNHCLKQMLTVAFRDNLSWLSLQVSVDIYNLCLWN